MAQFKEATLPGGGKIVVNMDQIRVMHWIPDTTTTLMMSNTLRNI
jgi:hypothetical protein